MLGSSSRTDPEAFFTGVKGDHEFGWVPSNGGVGEPAWTVGDMGDSMVVVAASLQRRSGFVCWRADASGKRA